MELELIHTQIASFPDWNKNNEERIILVYFSKQEAEEDDYFTQGVDLSVSIEKVVLCINGRKRNATAFLKGDTIAKMELEIENKLRDDED